MTKFQPSKMLVADCEKCDKCRRIIGTDGIILCDEHNKRWYREAQQFIKSKRGKCGHYKVWQQTTPYERVCPDCGQRFKWVDFVDAKRYKDFGWKEIKE
jgi:hypothetical protein